MSHFTQPTHRAEPDLASDAVAAMVIQQRHMRARIEMGLAQARAGDFASDDDVAAFFDHHAEPAE